MDNTDIPCIDLRGSEQKHPEKGHSATEEILKCDNDHFTIKEEVPESEVVQETDTESKPGCTNDIQGYNIREGVYSQQTFELKSSTQVYDSDSEEDQNEFYENLQTGHTNTQQGTIISEIGTVNEKYIANKKSGFSLYTSCRDRKSVVDIYKRFARSPYQPTHSGCLPCFNQQVHIQVEQNTQLCYQVSSDVYCCLFLQLVNLFGCLNVIAAFSLEKLEGVSTSGVTTASFRPSEIQTALFSQRQLVLQVNRSDHGFLLQYDYPNQFHRQIALIFHHELSDPPEQNIEELLKNPCEKSQSEGFTVHLPENVKNKADEEDRGCSSRFAERDFTADCFTEEKVKDGSCLQIGQQLTMPGQYHRKAYRHHAILGHVVTCQGQFVELELFHLTERYGVIDIFKTIEKYDLATADLRIIVCRYQRYYPNEIILRAKSMLNGVARGKFKKYSLITNNCEHFAMWCAVGIEKSWQVQKLQFFMKTFSCLLT